MKNVQDAVKNMQNFAGAQQSQRQKVHKKPAWDAKKSGVGSEISLKVLGPPLQCLFKTGPGVKSRARF